MALGPSCWMNGIIFLATGEFSWVTHSGSVRSGVSAGFLMMPPLILLLPAAPSQNHCPGCSRNACKSPWGRQSAHPPPLGAERIHHQSEITLIFNSMPGLLREHFTFVVSNTLSEGKFSGSVVSSPQNLSSPFRLYFTC